jgi:hypothetical protein
VFTGDIFQSAPDLSQFLNVEQILRATRFTFHLDQVVDVGDPVK